MCHIQSKKGDKRMFNTEFVWWIELRCSLWCTPLNRIIADVRELTVGLPTWEQFFEHLAFDSLQDGNFVGHEKVLFYIVFGTHVLESFVRGGWTFEKSAGIKIITSMWFTLGWTVENKFAVKPATKIKYRFYSASEKWKIEKLHAPVNRH